MKLRYMLVVTIFSYYFHCRRLLSNHITARQGPVKVHDVIPVCFSRFSRFRRTNGSYLYAVILVDLKPYCRSVSAPIQGTVFHHVICL